MYVHLTNSFLPVLEKQANRSSLVSVAYKTAQNVAVVYELQQMLQYPKTEHDAPESVSC